MTPSHKHVQKMFCFINSFENILQHGQEWRWFHIRDPDLILIFSQLSVEHGVKYRTTHSQDILKEWKTISSKRDYKHHSNTCPSHASPQNPEEIQNTLCPGTLWVPPGGPTTKWISAISSLLNMTVFLQRTNEQDPYIQCPQCNITCCLGRQHNRAMHKRTSDSPLSDGGIQALPVTSLYGVVVADVLLLVLLNSRGWDTGQFFSRKQLSGHFTNTCQLLRGGFHDRGSGNLWQNTEQTIQNDTKSIYYTYM